MGEAKRRGEETRRWLAALVTPEREIAHTALLAHERIVDGKGLVGGCYLLAFFLTRYLDEQHGIVVHPVVGWVNDGTSAFMSSHAWVESSGKITDIALTLTEDRRAQPRGAMLILGRSIRAGDADYSYHMERSQDAVDLLRELDEQMSALIQMKEAEHGRMYAVSQSKSLIKEYLDSAPRGHRYSDLASLLA